MNKYYNIGDSFKELLQQYIDNLENYYPTDDEISLIKDIKHLIKSRVIEIC